MGGAAGVGGSGAGGTGGSGGVGGGTTDPNSPGCGTPIVRPDRSAQQTMEVGGTTRYYLLDVPESADNETPLMLIFGLHGFDMNNVAVKDLYNFTERSNGQAITVLPQGEGPPPGDVSHWGDGVLESTWSGNQANYDFIQGLIASLGERYCLDRSRVFIVGFSMGAFFTNTIACEHNDWFRGFAPIAGGGPTSCGSDIQSAIMVQHGTEDPIVELSSGEETRDIWIEQNGCSQSSTSSFNGCESYDDCPEGKPVVWCTAAFDHYIPENVTANIWSFFSEL
jgi:polyhydroxybutyrate depolymerase